MSESPPSSASRPPRSGCDRLRVRTRRESLHRRASSSDAAASSSCGSCLRRELSWAGPRGLPSLYQRRLDVDVNPQAPRIVTEANITDRSSEHAGCSTLCLAVRATQGVNVHVDVLFGDAQKMRTIF